MADRPNPLKLNPLQCRTLAILQQLARTQGHAMAPAEDGSVTVGGFPPLHGNHYHVGDAVVMAADATGLHNPAVFTALGRKGLARQDMPGSAMLTPEGLAYDTGLSEKVLRRTDH